MVTPFQKSLNRGVGLPFFIRKAQLKRQVDRFPLKNPNLIVRLAVSR